MNFFYVRKIDKKINRVNNNYLLLEMGGVSIWKLRIFFDIKVLRCDLIGMVILVS